MASLIRRAGAEVLRTIARTLDPAAEANRVQLYSKSVGGVPQMFARSPDFARQISGAECNIWDRPLVPHALDDEFDSTTLAPAWTQTGGWTQGGINPFASFVAGNALYELHTDRRPSWVMVQPPDAAGNWGLQKDISSIGGGNFFAWFRGAISLRTSATQTSESTLHFQISASPFDNSNKVFVQIGPNGANTNHARFVRIQAGVATAISLTSNIFATVTGLQPIEAMGISRRGNNWDAWAFSGAGQAVWLGTTTLAIAPAVVSMDFTTTVNASPGNDICGVDFVRFKESALYLP